MRWRTICQYTDFTYGEVTDVKFDSEEKQAFITRMNDELVPRLEGFFDKKDRLGVIVQVQGRSEDKEVYAFISITSVTDEPFELSVPCHESFFSEPRGEELLDSLSEKVGKKVREAHTDSLNRLANKLTEICDGLVKIPQLTLEEKHKIIDACLENNCEILETEFNENLNFAIYDLEPKIKKIIEKGLGDYLDTSKVAQKTQLPKKKTSKFEKFFKKLFPRCYKKSPKKVVEQKVFAYDKVTDVEFNSDDSAEKQAFIRRMNENLVPRFVNFFEYMKKEISMLELCYDSLKNTFDSIVTEVSEKNFTVGVFFDFFSDFTLNLHEKKLKNLTIDIYRTGLAKLNTKLTEICDNLVNSRHLTLAGKNKIIDQYLKNNYEILKKDFKENSYANILALKPKLKKELLKYINSNLKKNMKSVGKLFIQGCENSLKGIDEIIKKLPPNEQNQTGEDKNEEQQTLDSQSSSNSEALEKITKFRESLQKVLDIAKSKKGNVDQETLACFDGFLKTQFSRVHFSFNQSKDKKLKYKVFPKCNDKTNCLIIHLYSAAVEQAYGKGVKRELLSRQILQYVRFNLSRISTA